MICKECGNTITNVCGWSYNPTTTGDYVVKLYKCECGAEYELKYNLVLADQE